MQSRWMPRLQRQRIFQSVRRVILPPINCSFGAAIAKYTSGTQSSHITTQTHACTHLNMRTLKGTRTQKREWASKKNINMKSERPFPYSWYRSVRVVGRVLTWKWNKSLHFDLRFYATDDRPNKWILWYGFLTSMHAAALYSAAPLYRLNYNWNVVITFHKFYLLIRIFRKVSYSVGDKVSVSYVYL